MSVPRIVVGSPVQQRATILAPFLEGLNHQNSSQFDLSFVFVDDNHEDASTLLLKEFAACHADVTIVDVERAEPYVCDDGTTHQWKESLIWRVAAMKDALIDHALEVEADYLFLVDSDIILRPQTIGHLAHLHKDVVSEVFWTQWTPDKMALPQVWLRDTYDIVHRRRGEELSTAEEHRRALSFVETLRTPGVYEVGGLGACTLISRSAMERGARFAEIPNLSFWGEDRHFCVRASALGLRLHADTHLPPLHLYRENDLVRLEQWRTEGDTETAPRRGGMYATP